MPYLSIAFYAVATFLTIDAMANLSTRGHNTALEILFSSLAVSVAGLIHLIATIRNDNR